MALPPLPELVLFMALVLVLSLYGLTVSGHFPEEHRAAVAADGCGPARAVGHDRRVLRADAGCCRIRLAARAAALRR